MKLECEMHHRGSEEMSQKPTVLTQVAEGWAT